ncbi:UDP-N-acetylglucosamine transferase subunit ALG14 [Candida viswanathii]|uniref:UDP-N-acetylglucosamine transferase subunit ALG14 n=1 Tax=Candida viswanathii TaxID=5486 RepID=A0A367YNJ0_9ASCO|nr:UDP-N-acetylglucosamine transferase subunit ALG14 [Candida viswanathii]
MDVETFYCIVIAFIFTPVFLVLVRLLYILPALRLPQSITDRKKLLDAANISILLGSGGHTGEMLRIISKTEMPNVTRTWIYSAGDASSLSKAKEFETAQTNNKTKANYISIPRARDVGQSYILSVPTTLYSFAVAAIKLLNHKPDVLLLNGPGTCVPVAYILFFYKFLGLCKTKIIYIESLARVSKLSLSGVLLLPISDRFIVQWENLYHQYNRVEYYGILI